MARAPGGRVKITHKCFICGKEANDPFGNAWVIIWLCEKHGQEVRKEEKISKAMIGIEALRNVQRKFLSES